jgi:peroxiredoxin
MEVTRRQWFFRGIIVVMMVGIIVRQYIKYRVAPELELDKLEFVNLDGSRFNTADLKGHNVLLTYFATWCGPCNAEIADMEAVRPLLEEQGFMLVHVTDEELGKVNGFMAKHPSGITYLLSPKPLAEIGVHTYPTHFVFDKQGTLRFKQTNELNWRTPSTVQDIVKVVE